MKIEKIQDVFIGTGEVKGFVFSKLGESDSKYLFRVDTGESEHFEVIAKILSPVCLDFEKRIYSETDFKESYPKSNQFGQKAWCFYSKEKAFIKLNSHETRQETTDQGAFN